MPYYIFKSYTEKFNLESFILLTVKGLPQSNHLL
jgi:hypothetical protein